MGPQSLKSHPLLTSVLLQGLWWGLMLGVLIQIIVIGLFTCFTDWQHQVHVANCIHRQLACVCSGDSFDFPEVAALPSGHNSQLFGCKWLL